MIELTQAEKTYILAKEKVSYSIITKADIVTSTYGQISIQPVETVSRCWCQLNAGAEVEDEICPCCGSNTRYPQVAKKAIRTLAMEEHAKTAKPKWYAPHTDDHCTLRTIFYVRKHPEKEIGIQIMKISLSLKAGNTPVDPEEFVWKINHVIDIIPNEKCRAYKISRGNEVEVDMFDAFQLNSKLLKDAPNLLFENSSGVIDFMLKHKKVNQYTGFMQCFNLADVVIPRNSFFMFYMYLYAQYPVMEFVVKMGYIDLIAKIMRNLATGCNKESIRASANELTKILNVEATNGSMALTVPRYIADDLNIKEARVEEYILWGDMCQMPEAGVISKENYLAIARSKTYAGLKYNLHDIPNIVKYGYAMKDVVKYVQKQVDNNDRMSHARTLTTWHDYLNMCDLMGVEPDRFPGNLVSAHDNVALAFQAKKDAMSDKFIAKIAEMAEKCIPDTQKYHDGQYVIVLPHGVADVVQEGQAQHNCVGSYIDRIAKRQSLVFFIRKKDDPDKSLVTAEYRSGKITQLYYKNNQRVNDKEIIEVASEFCKKLSNNREFVA